MKIFILTLLLISPLYSKAQTPNLHWKYQDDGKSYAEDRGICTAFDNSGNIVVAGYVESGCTAIDITVIKYSPIGDTLWMATYDGSGVDGQDDQPTSLTVDTAGNIYVTGYSEDSAFPYCVTIKYSPSGTLLWDQRYLAATSTGNDIEVDGTGNVYVCGFREISNNKDFLVIKYNAAGLQQWVENYTNGNHDEALSMELDATGNVYVSGRQSGVNFLFDWATLKYDPSGNQVWVDVFANPTASYSEEPVKLVIDNSGNIYVCGFAPLTTISNRDFYVIKYDVAGNRTWEGSYNHTPFNGDDYPVEMDVDIDGNVYVIGNSIGVGTGQDICAVKFNSSGEVAWDIRIDSVQQTDYARGIAYDAISNSLYIAGDITVPPIGFISRDMIVIKMDTAGSELARYTQNGPGSNFDLPYDITLNSSGEIAVTGMLSMNTDANANGDIATLLFNPQLTPIWTRYNNGNSFTNDQGADMVVDAAGNSYVCGFTYWGDIYYEDLTVFKINSSGERVWEYVYQGNQESSSEKAVAIAIDSLQNVYVTGTTDTSTGQNYRDIYTVMLNPSGLKVWDAVYDGPVGAADVPVAITVSPSGNVYVGATTVNTTTGVDGTVLCYNNAGSLLWSVSVDKGGQAETFNTMIMDAQQNVYAAGVFLPASGALSDGLLVKFDSNGTILWDTIYNNNTAPNSRDFFNSIALDNSGNVFVAGQSNNNFVAAKYSPAGFPAWIQNYSYSNFVDSATAIAVDINNDVLVAGTFGQPVEADFGLVKYKNDGTMIWDPRYANSAGSDDILNDIMVDDTGNVYLAGWETANFSTNYNFLILKYDSTGNFKYELMWTDSLGVAPDYGKRIGMDSTGNIYVMGDANENCFGNIFVNGFRWNTQVLRYGQGIFSDISEISIEKNDILMYPNPAKDYLNINIPTSIFGVEPVSVSLYDLQGREVYSTHLHGKELYSIDATTLPTGLLFYVVQNDLSKRQGKIIVVKD